MSGGVFLGRQTSLVISAWNLTYDGNKLGRRLNSVNQPMYDGEKEISSLVLIPCNFWKEKSKEEDKTKPLKQKLEERGKVFFKLARRQSMDYNGTTYTWPKR